MITAYIVLNVTLAEFPTIVSNKSLFESLICIFPGPPAIFSSKVINRLSFIPTSTALSKGVKVCFNGAVLSTVKLAPLDGVGSKTLPPISSPIERATVADPSPLETV